MGDNHRRDHPPAAVAFHQPPSAAADVRAVHQAAGCPLRDPRTGARPCCTPGGRRAPHPQTEHRQSRPVRIRGARRDHARHDPGTPPGPGLLRFQRNPVRPAGGGHPLRTRRRIPAIRRRLGIPGQRRLRVDHHDVAGLTRQRRSGAHPGPGLPAVDGLDLTGRRHAGALPLRRDQRLAARHRRPRIQDHPAHQGHGGDQPEQSHRGGL